MSNTIERGKFMKKFLTIGLLLSLVSLSSIRDNKPNFDKIDRYKNSKIAAGILQEFNTITPSYQYDKEGKHAFKVNFGIINYSYIDSLKSHQLTINKNLKDFLNTSFITNYYTKLEEYYNLKDKIKDRYKSNINLYYSYIKALIEKNDSLLLLESIILNEEVAKKEYELGKISQFDYDSIKSNLDYANLKVEEANLELLRLEEELELNGLDKTKVDLEDIKLYEKLDVDFDKLVKYNNEKKDVLLKLDKYSKLENKLNEYLPDINVFYTTDFKDKNNYGISISKTIELADSTYRDSRYLEKDLNLKKDTKEKFEKIYKNKKKLIEYQIKKVDLAIKDVEISKLNLKLGKINKLKFIEKLQDLNKEKSNLLNMQIELSKFLLESE